VLGLQRLETGLEAAHRLAAGLEGAEPGLERGDPGEQRLAALLGAGEPVGDLADAAFAGQGREPGVEPGRRRGLRRLQRLDPAAERVVERARLGGRADLLERPHPGAQLVEAGEGGLERGVLVADEPEELAGHRLQPLLRGAGLGREPVEPERELGLGLAERLQPVGGAAGRPCPARHAPPPLANREAEGPEGCRACGAQSREADPERFHLDTRTALKTALIKRGSWLAAG
jgi:hypothetical protein